MVSEVFYSSWLGLLKLARRRLCSERASSCKEELTQTSLESTRVQVSQLE